MRFALLVLLVAAACHKPDPKPRFTPAWEPFDKDGEGWLHTRRALVVADCQLHNLLSKAIPERNLSIESAIGTAIRPPQLDLFAGDVLAWVLKHGAPESELILHLGDALDLACDGEFREFAEVMQEAGKPWFMAPGNHDGFYFGNYHPDRNTLWEAACHKSGKPVSKDRFIRLYVAELLKQREPGCVSLRAALGDQPLPLDFDWKNGRDGFLKRIAWHIDEKRPWRSYIVQCVDMTGTGGKDVYEVRMVMLDSCQYQRQPKLLPNAWRSFPVVYNAGLTGEMLPNQLRVVRGWLDEMKAADQIGVFACHHPFEGLASRSQSAVGFLWREYAVGLLLTAHTHGGFFAHHSLGGDADEIEINIGSTTDWPMEWRVVQGHTNLKKGQVYIDAGRGILVDVLRKKTGFFQAGWEIPLDAPDDYRMYKQGVAGGLVVGYSLVHHYTPYWFGDPIVKANKYARSTEEAVKDTLLWTYHRLLTVFPTDPATPKLRWPKNCWNDESVLARIQVLAHSDHELDTKIDFLEELRLFERSRDTRDRLTGEATNELRAHYKISQAAWAARFESAKGRRLSVEDTLIRLDWKTSNVGKLEEGKQK
ncbi:MAG: metallophosphoesterase [Planctomycetota bacterium]|jgi:hypothetical protein